MENSKRIIFDAVAAYLETLSGHSPRRAGEKHGKHSWQRADRSTVYNASDISLLQQGGDFLLSISAENRNFSPWTMSCALYIFFSGLCGLRFFVSLHGNTKEVSEYTMTEPLPSAFFPISPSKSLASLSWQRNTKAKIPLLAPHQTCYKYYILESCYVCEISLELYTYIYIYMI